MGKNDIVLARYLEDEAVRFTEDNSGRFAALDEEAYDVITAVTGSQELEAVKERYREQGGKINMCEAIRGMIEDGRNEGMLAGRKEGIRLGKQEGIRLGKRQGEREKVRKVARNMYLRGMSAEDAASICEVSPEEVKLWFEEWRR